MSLTDIFHGKSSNLIKMVDNPNSTKSNILFSKKDRFSGDKVDQGLILKTSTIGILKGLLKTGKLNLRPRVDVMIYNDKGEILVEPSGFSQRALRIPGGGIEPGQSITQAAKMEALEEAGIEIGRGRIIHKPEILIWNDAVKKRNEDRGRSYDGNKQYFVAAPFKQYNKKEFGIEGDQLKNPVWANIKNVMAVAKEHGKMNEDYSNLSAVEYKALKNLRNILKTQGKI